MSERTPTPWEADNEVHGWWGGEQPGCMVRFVKGDQGHALANCLTQNVGRDQAKANAAFIVLACNNYHELVSQVAFWKARFEDEQRDHEATIKHANKERDEFST